MMKRITITAIMATAVYLSGSGNAAMNPRYFPGDWTAYTSVRFVHAAAVTPDFVYFGTRSGVARYDLHDDRWLPTLTTAEGLRANNVRRLAYDPLTDELFADTPLGISSWRPILKEWSDVVSFPDSLQQPWKPLDFTTLILPFGYSALTPGILTDPQLRSYQMLGMVQDFWGTKWIGTWGQFVWTVAPGSYQVTPQQWGLCQNDVEAIFLDSSMIFFGGPNYYDGGNGFTTYDTATGNWQYYEARYTEGFASDNISRIVGRPGGRYVWMATDRGVVRFDSKQQTFLTYGHGSGLADERVYALGLDGDILWIGTEVGIDGLYIPNDSIFHASTDALSNARINDIDVIGDVIWLGTDRGLYRLAKPMPEWRRYSTAEGPLAGYVRTLASDSKYLYAGSDRGIAIIDLTGREPVQNFERPSILLDENIFDLAVTEGIVWAATPSGLLRLNPQTHEQRMITTDDGLLDGLVQQIVVDGDYLWLGTAKGANRFRWKNPLRID